MTRFFSRKRERRRPRPARGSAASAEPVRYDLSGGHGQAEAAGGRGGGGTIACACHSPDYIAMQRPEGESLWSAEVTKMIKVYGARSGRPTPRRSPTISPRLLIAFKSAVPSTVRGRPSASARAAGGDDARRAEPGASGRTTRSRRQILAAGTALVGGRLAGRAMAAETEARTHRPKDASRAALDEGAGADVGSQPYGQPSPYEKDVIRNIPKGGKQYTSSDSRTPLQVARRHHHAQTACSTERHHGGHPAIDPAAHRLMIHSASSSAPCC